VIDSIRMRLTLWYVTIFAALLVFFSLFAYTLIRRSLYAQLDGALTVSANNAAAAFLQEMNEGHHTEAESAAEVLRQMALTNFQVAFLSGENVVAATQFAIWSHPALTGAQGVSRPTLTTVQAPNGEDARMIVLPMTAGGREYLIALAMPLRNVAGQLEDIRQIFFSTALLALAVAGAGGWLLARQSLAPVMAMSEQARRIGAGNLGERLRVNNGRDELGRLAAVFNDLLARMGHAFESQRQFTADAAHELRTPLAVIISEADVALSRERQPGEYQESLRVVKDEARRLARVVDDMLDLARADAGAQTLRRDEFYLNDLVDECCRAARSLAGPKRVALCAEPSPDVPYFGDEELLRRMLMNLLNNAVKYTPEGGEVRVSLESQNGRATITVADTGVGLTPEEAERVFDRFYRADKARSRAEGGTGLGLPIARWVAEAHRGSITLHSEPGHGSSFTVTLPPAEPTGAERPVRPQPESAPRRERG
jgi:heavy metal sensor kinase